MRKQFAAIFAGIAAVSIFALAASAGGGATNATATTTNKVDTATSTNKVKLKVIKVDSEETESESGHGTNAVDGKTDTFWHTEWTAENPPCPHEIIIEMTPPSTIKGFTYLARQDEEVNGTIKGYEFYISDDEKNFGQPVKKGELKGTKDKETVTFEPKKGRYFKLKAISELNEGAWSSAAEIGVVVNE